MSFELKLTTKSKVNKFTTIFKYLKNICPEVTINVDQDNLYIQGMCSAHVLLFELNISKDWFDSYETTFVSQVNLGVNCEILFKIINCINDGQMIKFQYCERNLDKLIISLENIDDHMKNPIKSFELSLMDIDTEYLEIPEVDTDIEMSLSSDQIVQIINELAQFGHDVKFECNEKGISLESVGDSNKMDVRIKDSDIESYAIVEDFMYEGTYSLKYLQNITAFQKLNKNLDITFIEDNPAIFMYDLNEFDWKTTNEDEIESEDDDEGSDDEENPELETSSNNVNKKPKNIIKFYLAPKID
jgi:proliferating cell nuclear antigen PCNA